MSDAVIQLRAVGKRYRKYDDTAVLINRGTGRIRRTKRSQIWALRGVDLDVSAGECVGIIGRNGGGKTTMLQLLAGVSAPTEGAVRVRGHVAPLMAVGVGFHQELTGRENVYVNGTILGRTRREMDDVFDDIVAFAQIGEFIDTPVKFYSSGMLVRLGFSVAIRSNPDVLLLDEVLAVGDVAFQARCFDRLQQMTADGATVVLVSHNLNAVRLLCDRVLVLDAGAPVFLGETDEALSVYHQILHEAREPEADGEAGAGPALELRDDNGRRTGHIKSGDAVTLIGTFHLPSTDASVEMVVSAATGQTVYAETWPVERQPSAGELRCELALAARLPGGTYTASLHLRAAGDGQRVAATAGPVTFFVGGHHDVRGIADLGATVTPA